MKVSECLDIRGWNLSHIKYPLPPNIKQQILSISIKETIQLDFMFSVLTKNNKFSFAKAFELIEYQPPDFDLAWIWNCKTAPKINFFLWLVALDRLPHRKFLFFWVCC